MTWRIPLRKYKLMEAPLPLPLKLATTSKGPASQRIHPHFDGVIHVEPLKVPARVKLLFKPRAIWT